MPLSSLPPAYRCARSLRRPSVFGDDVREPIGANCNRQAPEGATPLPAIGASAVSDLGHLHRRRIVAEAIALLCRMSDARPREMIGEQRGAVRRQHVEHAYAGLGRLLGV